MRRPLPCDELPPDARPRQMTFDHRGLFGRVVVTYAVRPLADRGSHLLLRIRWDPRRRCRCRRR